jgi:hypothetical protein
MLRIFPALIAAVLAFTADARSQTYFYDQIQQRDSNHHWLEPVYIGNQKASITGSTIDLTAKERYRLSIISKTLLPGNGMIYLCKDSNLQDVTVMMMPDGKMIIYDATDRYLIDLQKPIVQRSARGLADSD